MIQIPLEIGDIILAGRFKNKKITVKEISVDEYGNPTVNGRSILKIRIPKLYQKQENIQENNMTAKEMKQRMLDGIQKDGTSFELRDAYGNCELWANGTRLEAGSVKDCYNTWIKYRFNPKYEKKITESKLTEASLTPDKLKVLDTKIEWATNKSLPASQGEAIKQVIKQYRLPAIQWGWIKTGGIIAVETQKQKMFWQDKGHELQFLGIMNKDVQENKQLKENKKLLFVKSKNIPFIKKEYGLSVEEIYDYEQSLIQKSVPELRKLQGIVRQQQDKLRTITNPTPQQLKAGKQLDFRDQMLMAAVDYVAFEKPKNESVLKEEVKSFQKSPIEVKIRKDGDRFHIFLQTVDGEQQLSMQGWETKEQAEHAAMMKGYKYDGNPYFEKHKGIEVPKATKSEPVKHDKPKEMDLGKEKELKIENFIRKVIRTELSKKKVQLKEEISPENRKKLLNLQNLQNQVSQAKAQVEAVIKSTGLKDLEKQVDKLLKEELWDFLEELKKDEQRLVDLGEIIMTVDKFQSEYTSYEYEPTLDYALTQVNQDVKEKVLLQLKSTEKINKRKGSLSFTTKNEAFGNSIWNSITSFLSKILPTLKRKGQKIDRELVNLKNVVSKMKVTK